MELFEVRLHPGEPAIRVEASDEPTAALAAAPQLLQKQYPGLQFTEVYSCIDIGNGTFDIHLKAYDVHQVQYSPRLLVRRV